MLEHLGVHRRSKQHRCAGCGVERGQEVVGDAVRQLGDDIRGGRRDQEKVDGRRQGDVLDVGVRARLELIGDDAALRDRF